MMNEKPLGRGRRDFIFHVEDFVSVARHSEKSVPLADFLEVLFDHWPDSMSGIKVRHWNMLLGILSLEMRTILIFTEASEK